MAEPIKVDIWSDIACPWCYIGKRNFEAGLAAYAGGSNRPDVEVEYHSYQLAPDTPVDFEGGEVEYLAERKGLSEEQVHAMLERVTGVAKEAGLDYDFDALKHTNTVKAHQLLHFAKAKGKQVEAKERLLAAYFIEGRHVGREADLADLAADVGLDRAEALQSLESDEYLAAVRADEALANEYGIRGVPFFVFDDKYGLSGAQPPDTFAQVLAQVADERTAEVTS